MKLTDEEKELIYKKVDERLEKADKLIFEFNIYKWLARLFLTLLGISSIWVLIYFQKFIDKKIGEGIDRLDGFAISSSNAVNGDYFDAYIILEKNWEMMQEKKYLLSDEIREYYYSYVTYLFSAIDKPNEKGNFIGIERWKQLHEDSKFINFRDQEINLNNFNFIYNYAICELKFNAIEKSFDDALSKMGLAKKHCNYFQDEAWISYDMAILEYLKGNSDTAISLLKHSIKYDPLYYDPDLLIKYSDSYFYSSKSHVFFNVYERLIKNKLTTHVVDTTKTYQKYKELIIELYDKSKK